MSTDRSHLSLELLHKAYAGANLAKLKLREALTTFLAQDSLSIWLTGAVAAAVSGRDDGECLAPAASPPLDKGTRRSASSSSRPAEGRRPDIIMPGSVPAASIKGLSCKRSVATSRDSLGRQSWGICSISETDDDGGSSAHSGSYFFMESESTWNHSQAGRRVSGQLTEALLSTDSRGPSRTSSQGSMPMQLPGVVESLVWSDAVISGGLSPPSTPSNTLALPIFCASDALLPPEALELVRAAAGSTAAAYRHWLAGMQLARKAAEAGEGIAPEVEATGAVLSIHGDGQGQPPMLSLLTDAANGTQVSAATVSCCAWRQITNQTFCVPPQ